MIISTLSYSGPSSTTLNYLLRPLRPMLSPTLSPTLRPIRPLRPLRPLSPMLSPLSPMLSPLSPLRSLLVNFINCHLLIRLKKIIILFTVF